MTSYPENAARSASAHWQQVWPELFDCDRDLSLPYPHVPVSALLQTAARRFPDRAACTLFGQPTTYAELDDQARRLARALAELGARPGRHVGMFLPNIPEYLIALQATWLTGATVLQLSPLMVAEEVAHWLEAVGCHIVITLDLLAPVVMGAMGRGPLEHIITASLVPHISLWRGWLYRIEHLRRNGSLRLREDAHHHRFDNLLQTGPLEQSPPVVPAEDVAVLAPTGGTTASPKAVMLTHRNLVANAFQLRHWVGGEDGTESTLGVLPLFHAYGLTTTVLTTWVKGGTVHLLPRFEARAALRVMERYRTELVAVVPLMLNALNQVLRRRPRDLSYIRAVVSGASALDPAVRAEFETYHPQHLVEGYGLTEASPVTHANPLGPGNRPGTIGLPLADTEARVVDPVTGVGEVPDGTVGELVVRGPQVMKGYFNNPEATAAVLRDGWLYTGDLARRDADGYFILVDRKKDIIKTSGYLVYPAEVEEVLAMFPGVAEAAVIGRPDAERGEVVTALVVARDQARLDLAALERYCREHLGKHKRPRQIEVVAELPKNFLGKVLRRRLREMAGRGPAVGPAAT
ncbi:MAG TPA: AMP-binding protein [Gemmataceae bacterium]|nr:AMP-binding protein [Gemmataceae bacterium]